MRKGKKITLFHMLKVLIPLAFKACPTLITIALCMSVLYSISEVAVTFTTQYFFQALSELLLKTSDLTTVWFALASLAFALVFSHIFNGLHNGTVEDISYRIMGNMGSVLHKKASNLGTLYFEDSSNLDEIEKAKEGVINSTFFLNVIFIIITYYIPYFIFMTMYLAKLKPILSISIIFIFIPVASTQLLRVKMYSNLSNDSALLNRKFLYYEKCICDKEYFKETRILGAVEYFKGLYCNTLRQHNKVKWNVDKKVGLTELAMKGITLLGYILVLLLLVRTLLSGDISIGAFAAVFASINRMFTMMEVLICSHIGRLSNDLGSIKNYINFLNTVEKQGVGILDDKSVHGISLKKVSFKYPNSNKYILKDINLYMKPGETLAIVGENGAGKTTLVKLMTGLYEPSEGVVEIGNVDTRVMKPESIRANISAVFQNFQRYRLSLWENVIISETNYNERDYDNNVVVYNTDDTSKNKTRFDDTLMKSSLEIVNDKLIYGYDTILSREFGGIDISGGEWQKVAIARGIYKHYNTMILDEPTASIDPNEETRIYRMFETISKDKTAIIVTHRLGAAKIADKIIVLDSGKITEQGTHEELLLQDGEYAKMYNIQKAMYQ